MALKSVNYDATNEELQGMLRILKSEIHRYMRHNNYRRAGKFYRPTLTPEQKQKCLKWAIQHQHDNFEFTVDIDEKWFYVIRKRGLLELPKGITAPKR